MNHHFSDIIGLRSSFKSSSFVEAYLLEPARVENEDLREVLYRISLPYADILGAIYDSVEQLVDSASLYKVAYHAYHISDAPKLRDVFNRVQHLSLWIPELRELALISGDLSSPTSHSSTTLRVAFADYWFCTRLNLSFLSWHLHNLYQGEVIFTIPSEADLVVCGPYTSYSAFSPCILGRPRLFWSGESDAADAKLYDGSLSSSNFFESPTNIYYPPWFGLIEFFKGKGSLYGPGHITIPPRYLYEDPLFQPQDSVAYDVSAVISNPVPDRLALLDKLEEKGLRIIRAGRAFGVPTKYKSEILRQSYSNLCSENKLSPGYITEKPIESLLLGCLPIYNGHASVASLINPELLFLQESFSSDYCGFVDAVSSVDMASYSGSLRGASIFANPPSISEICLKLTFLLHALLGRHA